MLTATWQRACHRIEAYSQYKFHREVPGSIAFRNLAFDCVRWIFGQPVALLLSADGLAWRHNYIMPWTKKPLSRHERSCVVTVQLYLYQSCSASLQWLFMDVADLGAAVRLQILRAVVWCTFAKASLVAWQRTGREPIQELVHAQKPSGTDCSFQLLFCWLNGADFRFELLFRSASARTSSLGLLQDQDGVVARLRGPAGRGECDPRRNAGEPNHHSEYCSKRFDWWSSPAASSQSARTAHMHVCMSTCSCCRFRPAISKRTDKENSGLHETRAHRPTIGRTTRQKRRTVQTHLTGQAVLASVVELSDAIKLLVFVSLFGFSANYPGILAIGCG